MHRRDYQTVAEVLRSYKSGMTPAMHEDLVEGFARQFGSYYHNFNAEKFREWCYRD
jgi:hypothetical protein